MDFDNPQRLRQGKRLPVKLVFDTGRTAAPGTRRRESPSRHLLYEVEELCLDLRLDRPKRSAAAVVVGQLADRQDPLRALAGLPVLLVSKDQLLTRTVSNRQGEFRVQYDTDNSVSLCLSLDGDRLIEIPVSPQAVEGSSSASKA